MSISEIDILEITTEYINITYVDQTSEILPNNLDTYKMLFQRWLGDSQESLRFMHLRMTYYRNNNNIQLLHTFMILIRNLHVLISNTNTETSTLENNLTVFFHPSNKVNVHKFLNYMIKLSNINIIEKSISNI
jgi:hypothetical protein